MLGACFVMLCSSRQEHGSHHGEEWPGHVGVCPSLDSIRYPDLQGYVL